MKNKIFSKETYYVLIVVSIVLLVLAICCVISSKFIHAVNNISYYEEEYEYCKLKASGYFYSSDYADFALTWKKLHDDALKCIVLHIAGAIMLSAGGGVGLYYSITKLKYCKENVFETENDEKE